MLDINNSLNKQMTLCFLIEKSSRMMGKKIDRINIVIKEILEVINVISQDNPDTEIKVTALEFSTDIKWKYHEPVMAKDFLWEGFQAVGGASSLGAACVELSSKLSRKAFFDSPSRCVAPVIILLSDGCPTDDYNEGLKTLKSNKWFNAAIKLAIVIDDEADTDALKQFTGDAGNLIDIHSLDRLRTIIQVSEVSTSHVSSESRNELVFNPVTGLFEMVSADRMHDENLEPIIEISQQGFFGGGPAEDYAKDADESKKPFSDGQQLIFNRETGQFEVHDSQVLDKCEKAIEINYYPKISKRYQLIKDKLWDKFFGPKYHEVYSSVFASAEVKRNSHLLVQVYLHLEKEIEKVKSLAKESDKNAERRDYMPLSLKLRKGDKVDVEFNIYGETRLKSERKSVIWQGSFTKCSFDYFVPGDIDVDELSCEADIFVNGAMIGEMRFLTQIVEVPRNLNPEILSHRFNRIFISYAHQDAKQIKLLALAYKAQGVDYFYDRDSLAPGDVYEEKIFDYIDSSDLFVLCWSKNAAVSDYVAKEKGRALLRAYPQLSRRDATLKICPISIEPRAELPADMKEVYNFEVI
jgi:uncharacterized protein YegL